MNVREGWFERLLFETDFVRKWPAYAGVLSRMDPIATTVVPIAAVALRRWNDPSSRIQLLVNLDYFSTHLDQREAILLHEIQHILLGHLRNARFHAVRYPRVMELAMEISADEPLSDLFPNGAFTVEAFAPFGVRRGQSTMDRYRALTQAFERGTLGIPRSLFSRMRDTHRPARCGAHGTGLGDLLDARSDGASEQNWNRVGGGVSSPTSRAEIERMKLTIARHLRGDRGGEDDPFHDPTQQRIAKELRRIVFDDDSGSAMDWRRVLREAFPRHRLVRHDYLRPNRRFPQRVGEIPGRVRRAPKPALLVGIDTSGSMTGDVLDRVAREVRRLAAHARLTIVECDAAVHRVYPFATPLGPFVGGGDTDFAPVFGEAHTRRFDGVVYFTDGRGNLPDVPPALPVLWALTHGDPFLAEWGSVVRLPSS